MRCTICDYSNSVPSLFNEGLSSGSYYRRIVASKNYGFVCTTCLDDIVNTLFSNLSQCSEFEDPDNLYKDEENFGIFVDNDEINSD
jgi:hypothetical protein